MPTTVLPARTSLWQWLQVALLVVNMWWTTLCLGGYRPETMVFTSGLTGLLLMVHFIGLALAAKNPSGHWRPSLRRIHPAGWCMLPFVVYAAANAAWVTPVPWLGWHDWLMWAQMFAIFWVVLNGVRSNGAWNVLFVALFTLGCVTVALASYQRFVKPDWLMLGRTQAPQFYGRASGSFGIPNSLGAFLLLLLPAAGALACQRGLGFGRRLMFATLALVFAFGLVLTVSRGAWLGLALALALWPMLGKNRHWARRVGGAALVLGLLLAFGVMLYSWVPVVRARLDALVTDAGERSRPIMWRGAWSIFRDHPVLGGGAGCFNVLFEKYRPEAFQDEPQWAHNDYLNTLCDYGLLGFGLFFAAAGFVGIRSWRGMPTVEEEVETGSGINHRGFRRALGIGVLAFGLQLFVDFHFKIPALAMVFATIAAWLVQRGWQKAGRVGLAEKPRRLAYGAAAAGTALGMILLVIPHYRAEAKRYNMRRQIDHAAGTPLDLPAEQDLFLRSREAFTRATEIDPSNAQAWSDRAYATALTSLLVKNRNIELGKEAEIYARQALNRSEMLSEFWLRLGVALDMQGRWVEAGDAFVQALHLAPANSSVWFYQAYHLSLKPSTRQMAEAAIATCLRLDAGRPDAEALRQRLAVGQ